MNRSSTVNLKDLIKQLQFYEELDRTTFIMRRNEIDRQNLQKKLEEERKLNSGDDEQ